MQVAVEKPNPVIFEHACHLLGVQPHEVVHVGDDRRFVLLLAVASPHGPTRSGCIVADCRRPPVEGSMQGVSWLPPCHCCACRNDIMGARSAGCHAWLWGSDVHSFRDVEQAIADFNRAAAAAT